MPKIRKATAINELLNGKAVVALYFERDELLFLLKCTTVLEDVEDLEDLLKEKPQKVEFVRFHDHDFKSYEDTVASIY